MDGKGQRVKLTLGVNFIKHLAKSKKRILALAFTLPFITRLIPELFFPVPVGFDTAIHLYGAKYNPFPDFKFRIFERFLLPYVYHSLGIELTFFMKFYSPVIFALMTLLLTSYASYVLKWGPEKLLLLTLLLSLNPALLRMSWDNHSQNLATLQLIALLLILGRKPALPRLLAVIPLAVMIALTHQLVSVIALGILIFELFYLARPRLRLVPYITVILLAILSIPAISPVLAPNRSIPALQSIAAEWNSGVDRIGLVNQAIAATWYTLPASFFGIFRERRLLAWLATSAGVYLFALGVGNPTPVVPGRWAVYSVIPLTFFAANAYRPRAGIRGVKAASLTLTILFTLSTGFGMVLPSGTAVTEMMHSSYPEFPPTLASSTAKKEHVEAIIKFTSYLNRNDDKACIITHYPWFFWWTGYYYKGKTIYNGPKYTDEKSLIEQIKSDTRLSKCGNKIYIIWFTGLAFAEEVQRLNELSLYELENKRAP